MKLSMLLLTIGFYNLTASVYSQSVKLNLTQQNVTLKEIFASIEKETSYKFLYRSDLVNMNSLMSINEKGSSLEEVLDKLLDGSNIKYSILDNNLIVLTPITTVLQDISIKGTVSDKDGSPLPGVNVTVKGTSKGVVTDLNGQYLIDVPSNTSTLVFSFVGYNSEEVVVGDQRLINITLLEDIKQLNEVVVTALGIKRDRKALGYAMQEVKSDELNKTSDANVVSSLQGKVAGVEINQAGAGVGSSAKVTIRGNRSLSGSNEPLWIVDGIPFGDDSNGAGGEWGGVDRAGAAYDINPQDIESISVLKGPNAAALYGSRASNGVIVITTKKGSKNQKGLGVEYNGGVTISKAAYFLDQQTKYGQGVNGVYSSSEGGSWGPEMKGQDLVSWTGNTIPYSAQTNRIPEFFRTGISQTHNLSVAGGSDKGSIRISLGNDNNKGIFKYHEVAKTNYDLKADYKFNKFLTVDTKISYVNTHGTDRPEMGNYGIMAYLYTMPMNIRSEDLKPGYTIDPATGEHVEVNFKGPNANYRNPYFIQEQMRNEDWRYRGFGYVGATLNFTKNLSLKIQQSLDFYRERVETKTLYSDKVYNVGRPSFDVDENFYRESNSEFLLRYNREKGDFTTNFSIGGNIRNDVNEGLYSSSGKLAMEGSYFLDLGTNKSTSNSYSEKEVQSLYGYGQFAYKNFVFLDLTARNDWSSTLPKNNCSYFYPSVSLSGIISDMAKLPEWISFLKVRGSWAKVGNDVDPYQLYSTYSIGTGPYKYVTANTSDILYNSNLKPEMTTSMEGGTDIRFLNGRVGLDLTAYSTKTRDQMLIPDLDQSTGYARKVINAGEISNKGIEVMLTTVPVKTDKFSINLDFNFAKNNNEVVSLDPQIKTYVFGSINNGPEVIAREGHTLGEIRDQKYVRDANGHIVVGSDGMPEITSGKEILGSIQPDWTGSVKLSSDYKGFYFSSLIGIQQGGDIVSMTESYAAKAGTAKRTENRADFVVPNSVFENGTANNVAISAQDFWVNSPNEDFVYSASYVKLKELALGYTIPKTILDKFTKGNINSFRLSFVGRNLFYFKKNTPGTVPDGSALNRTIFAQAVDFSPVPNTRTYGFTLSVGF